VSVVKIITRCPMAGKKNHTAAVMLAAGALLLAGCMADSDPGPAGERAFGLTGTETAAAQGCAGTGASLSGSVTLNREGDVVWMVEDGRPLCAGSLEEVRGELAVYEARLQSLDVETLGEHPTNRDLKDSAKDHDNLFAPTYDPNPVPAGETHESVRSLTSPSTSGDGEDGIRGPIPDPNPVPALFIAVQAGSLEDAASSGDSEDDDDHGGGPRFDLAMLMTSLR